MPYRLSVELLDDADRASVRRVGGHSQIWTKLDKVIVIYLQINKCAIREMNMISQL